MKTLLLSACLVLVTLYYLCIGFFPSLLSGFMAGIPVSISVTVVIFVLLLGITLWYSCLPDTPETPQKGNTP